mgnify:FL=1
MLSSVRDLSFNFGGKGKDEKEEQDKLEQKRKKKEEKAAKKNAKKMNRISMKGKKNNSAKKDKPSGSADPRKVGGGPPNGRLALDMSELKSNVQQRANTFAVRPTGTRGDVKDLFNHNGEDNNTSAARNFEARRPTVSGGGSGGAAPNGVASEMAGRRPTISVTPSTTRDDRPWNSAKPPSPSTAVTGQMRAKTAPSIYVANDVKRGPTGPPPRSGSVDDLAAAVCLPLSLSLSLSLSF